MKRDDFNDKHYIADEGKVFVCKIHRIIMGTEIYLGVHFIDGEIVEDIIDNYEEINDVQNNTNNNA